MSVGLRLLAAISENGSTTSLRGIQPEFLVDADEQTVYDFITTHYRRYRELPVIETIEEETRIRMPETPEHIDFYIQEVHNRRVYTQVRDEFTTLRNNISQSNIDGILESANVIRSACTPFTGQQQELYRVDQLAPELLEEYIRKHYNPGMSGVATGWSYLDEQTGGWQDGDLIVWVARPAAGKTHLSIHQALSAWLSGKSILYVSMEMTLKQIGMRMASQLAGLNPDYVRKGLLSKWGEARLHAAIELLRSSRSFHLYAGNFNKTTSSVEMLIQELSPDVVFIDGMYLMTPAKNVRGGRFESAAYLVDEIKRMCLTTERPIIATTQFGRDAGKGGKNGTLENIGYTDTIGTHASVVLSITLGKPKSVPIRVDSTSSTGNITSEVVGYKNTYPYRKLGIMKGREGESGDWGIKFSFAPTSFAEVPMSLVLGEEDVADEPDLDYMR